MIAVRIASIVACVCIAGAPRQSVEALEKFDPRKRFGVIRGRLERVHGRLRSSVDRRRHAADTRFRATAARLDSLSPLAVLGRGYAVCWNADRTRIIRDASAVERGDQVRVRLERGELDCLVEGKGDE